MSLPRFILGMLSSLLVFAVATFFITHSIWTTLLGTLLCALVIQVGYFLVVLFLVFRDPKSGKDRVRHGGVNAGSGRKVGAPEVVRRSRIP